MESGRLSSDFNLGVSGVGEGGGLPEGFARVHGLGSAASPDKLPWTMITGIVAHEAGAVQCLDQLLASWVSRWFGL